MTGDLVVVLVEEEAKVLTGEDEDEGRAEEELNIGQASFKRRDEGRGEDLSDDGS